MHHCKQNDSIKEENKYSLKKIKIYECFLVPPHDRFTKYQYILSLHIFIMLLCCLFEIKKHTREIFSFLMSSNYVNAYYSWLDFFGCLPCDFHKAHDYKIEFSSTIR